MSSGYNLDMKLPELAEGLAVGKRESEKLMIILQVSA